MEPFCFVGLEMMGKEYVRICEKETHGIYTDNDAGRVVGLLECTGYTRDGSTCSGSTYEDVDLA